MELLRYVGYSSLMKIAHKFNWHYATPIYPEGDTQLWCKWCGFRQTIKKVDNPAISHSRDEEKNKCQ
jgi:hypothetical protein